MYIDSRFSCVFLPPVGFACVCLLVDLIIDYHRNFKSYVVAFAILFWTCIVQQLNTVPRLMDREWEVEISKMLPQMQHGQATIREIPGEIWIVYDSTKSVRAGRPVVGNSCFRDFLL